MNEFEEKWALALSAGRMGSSTVRHASAAHDRPYTPRESVTGSAAARTAVNPSSVDCKNDFLKSYLIQIHRNLATFA